jgi:hypothetical protein
LLWRTNPIIKFSSRLSFTHISCSLLTLEAAYKSKHFSDILKFSAQA